MSVLKKIGIIILSFIVILLLSLTILTSSLVKYTNKDFITETSLETVLSVKQDVLKQYNLNEDDIKQGISLFCSNQKLIKNLKNIPQINNAELDFIKNVDNLQEYGVTCDTINTKGVDDIIKTVLPIIIDKYYDKEYSCDYLDCVKQDSLTAVSVTFNKKGHSFFSLLFWIFLVISLVLLVIIFLLSESYISGLRNLGINSVIVGINFIVIIIIKAFVIDGLIPSNDNLLHKLINEIISRLLNVIQDRFLVLFILGIILIIISIVLKYVKPVQEVKGGILKE